MPLFICKIGSADGRIIEKEFEAASSDILRQNLTSQGFFVFSISKKPLQFLWNKGASRRKIDIKSLITFNQELLVLIKAGLPIIQSLDTILERIEKGRLAEVLEIIRDDIKGGSSLSDAFERHPSAFSHLYIASIRAGERTGDLPQTIKRYITFLKKTEGFRKKVITALFYPAILLSVAFVAITLLLVYVVPTFSQVYADAGSRLPTPTLVLIAFTSILKKFFPLLIGAVVCGVYFFRRWANTESGRMIVDKFTLKIPVIGDVFAKYAIVSFTRTLATIIESGIPIVESLRMSVGTLNNKVLEVRLTAAIRRVEEGVSLSVAIDGAKLMPTLALRMLSVGESTGSLEEMLEGISDYFEEELDQKLHLLSTAIEPAIMVIMGVVIGTIIVTMYLPVFKIAGTVG
ncbi:MAG: type II secretion system F family protein [Geobacteraceae bacterium]|nr:type II secretion system F family protein [Geobacteraceae bacterium]